MPAGTCTGIGYHSYYDISVAACTNVHDLMRSGRQTCGNICKGTTDATACTGTNCSPQCTSVKDCSKDYDCVGVSTKWDPDTGTSKILENGVCRPVKRDYTATDLAWVWLSAMSDATEHGIKFHTNSIIKACAMGVTVSLGECQHFGTSDPRSPTYGGCDNIISNQHSQRNNPGVRSGGIWQVSGPLSFKKTDMPAVKIDNVEYDCMKYYKSPTDFWGDYDETNLANSPVCQARMAMWHAKNGCALAPGAQKLPLCDKSEMQKKTLAERQKSPCWAGALCITGQPARWPGRSNANGWTNSYGHYFQSCVMKTPPPYINATLAKLHPDWYNATKRWDCGQNGNLIDGRELQTWNVGGPATTVQGTRQRRESGRSRSTRRSYGKKRRGHGHK